MPSLYHLLIKIDNLSTEPLKEEPEKKKGFTSFFKKSTKDLSVDESEKKPKAGLFKRPTTSSDKGSQNCWFPGTLKTYTGIPQIAMSCMQIIADRGLESTGIYRLSGNAATISRIKADANKQNLTELLDPSLDVNVVSGLLKCKCIAWRD